MPIEELTPEQLVRASILGFVMIGLLLAGLMALFYAGYRFKNRIPFNLARRPLATVGLIDILVTAALMFVGVIFVQTLAVSLYPEIRESMAKQAVSESSDESLADAAPDQQPETELASDSTEDTNDANDLPKTEPERQVSAAQVVMSGVMSTLQLLVAVVVFVFIYMRTGCSLRSLGIQPDRVGRDIGIGMWVLFLTIPLLLVFSGVVNYLSGVKYNHPVIDMMESHPWLFWVIAWMAVVVAPLTEEFFFRTVLIGWFESIHCGRSGQSALIGWNPSLDVGGGASVSNPYEHSVHLGPAADANANFRQYVGSSNGVYVPPWWPAILSGVLFGVAHAGYGMSWVPLVVFGVVLGRVYQLRQSLLTVVAIHLVFNGINLFNLWLSIGLDVR